MLGGAIGCEIPVIRGMRFQVLLVAITCKSSCSVWRIHWNYVVSGQHGYPAISLYIDLTTDLTPPLFTSISRLAVLIAAVTNAPYEIDSESGSNFVLSRDWFADHYSYRCSPSHHGSAGRPSHLPWNIYHDCSILSTQSRMETLSTGASSLLPSTTEVHQMYFFHSSAVSCDLINPVQTLEPRVFRLEDNMMTMAKVREKNSKK